MKLVAQMYGDEEPQWEEHGEPQEENIIEVEFTDVKCFEFFHEFFIVVKNTGEKYAVNRYKIESFKLINE